MVKQLMRASNTTFTRAYFVFHIYEINIIDIHAKFVVEWQPLIEVNTNTWSPPTLTIFDTSQIAWVCVI